MEFKPGDILVAHPDLGFDPDFGRSVIVITANEQGAISGVNISTGHITGNMFKGGPLKMPVPVALHKASDSISTSRPVGKTGFVLTELEDYDRISELFQKKPKDIIFLAGYAGWGPGQLEGEIQQGLWKKVDNISLETLLSVWPAEQRWALASGQKPEATVVPALLPQPGRNRRPGLPN